MTAEQWLNDLEAKADAATPGDWFPDGYDVQTENNDACVCCCNVPTVDIEDENEQEANTTFIAAANPAAVKRLVAMVKALAVITGNKICVTPDAKCPKGSPCDQCAIEYAYKKT